MRKLLLLSACLTAFAALAFADDKDKKKEDKSKSEATVIPAELAVNRKLDSKTTFANYDQTRVSFLVSIPKKYLLGVDKTSKLASMKDDKGNSLIDEKSPFSGGFSQFPQLAEDGSSMLAGVNAYNKAPGKGATKVLIKGDLIVICGSDEKTDQVKKIEFKAKEKAKVADMEVMVTSEKETFGGADGPAFTITSKTKNVKGVVVKDADGKAVEVAKRGWFGSGDQWTFNFALVKPLKEGSIHVTYFSKAEKITVPIDLSVGVDLGR